MGRLGAPVLVRVMRMEVLGLQGLMRGLLDRRTTGIYEEVLLVTVIMCRINLQMHVLSVWYYGSAARVRHDQRTCHEMLTCD